MECPHQRDNPPAWAIVDEDGDPISFVIRSPLGAGGSRWVSLPVDGFMGIPVIGFSNKRPKGAAQLLCPLQSDDAYQAVAEACAQSAISYGYYPDTRGPLVELEGEEQPDD